MPLVEINQLTQALNVTKQWVGKLVQEGMPKEARGKYDLGKCMLWYIRYLQAALKRRSGNQSADDEGKTEARERLRLLSAEAELKELELSRERGEFVALSDVERTLTDLVMTTKARILAVGPRVAPNLVGQDRLVIEAEIEKELKAALSYLAQSVSNGNGHHADSASASERTSES